MGAIIGPALPVIIAVLCAVCRRRRLLHQAAPEEPAGEPRQVTGSSTTPHQSRCLPLAPRLAPPCHEPDVAPVHHESDLAIHCAHSRLPVDGARHGRTSEMSDCLQAVSHHWRDVTELRTKNNYLPAPRARLERATYCLGGRIRSPAGLPWSSSTGLISPRK